jgi:hypothetical protein
MGGRTDCDLRISATFAEKSSADAIGKKDFGRFAVAVVKSTILFCNMSFPLVPRLLRSSA